jgi:hypothetical protein
VFLALPEIDIQAVDDHRRVSIKPTVVADVRSEGEAEPGRQQVRAASMSAVATFTTPAA